MVDRLSSLTFLAMALILTAVPLAINGNLEMVLSPMNGIQDIPIPVGVYMM